MLLILCLTQNVATIGGKQYPDTQFVLAGPDACATNHHHAANGLFVTALDGTTLPDAGACGYGLLTFAALAAPAPAATPSMSPLIMGPPIDFFLSGLPPIEPFRLPDVVTDGSSMRGSFSEASGLDVEIDPIEYRFGSEDTTIRKLPGIMKYVNIELRAGDLPSTSGVTSDLLDGRAPTTPPTPSGALGPIFTGQKGTQDLGTTAQRIFDAAGGEFEWTTDERRGQLPGASTFQEFTDARRMSCYEFVHFVGYFCGAQPSAPVFDDVPDSVFDSDPNLTRADIEKMGYESRPAVLIRTGDTGIATNVETWDGESEIPAGKVVMGVAWAFNNSGGYFHVGISLGGGKVISLGGGDNLAIETVDDCFGGIGYRTVQFGDYNFGGQPASVNR